MAYEFFQERVVEFAETDMAGIVHFSNFFRWIESTEHAFFRSLGFSIHHTFEGMPAPVGWPRVETRCRFIRPLKFEDRARVHLLVQEVRNKAVRYAFRVQRQEGDEWRDAAHGWTTAVCVAFSEDGMKATSLPEQLRAALEAAPKELLPEE